jgi:hypothetical protein
MRSEALRVLSVIPPMTQLNTPYPSTAYLTGFLRSRGIPAVQEDLALALVLRLFSRDGPAGAARLHPCLPAKPARHACRPSSVGSSATSRRSRLRWPSCRDAIRPPRTASPGATSCPRASRFGPLDAYVDDEGGDPLAWAFGALGVTDRARHFATLYLDDIADVLREAVDARFEFVRYAESLAQSQASFEPLAQALAAPENLVDRHAARTDAGSAGAPCATGGAAVGAVSRQRLWRFPHRPGDQGGTIPAIVTVLGGGFVNTELRELAEPRVFDFFDYVTLDDGERPLLALLEHLAASAARALVRSFPARRRRCVTSMPASRTSPSPRPARRPGTACRWIATSRCWTCSIPCTGSGRTRAGTS